MLTLLRRIAVNASEVEVSQSWRVVQNPCELEEDVHAKGNEKRAQSITVSIRPFTSIE